MSCDNHPTDLFRMVSSDEYAWTEASVQTEVQASWTTSITGQTSFETGQTSFDAFVSDKDMLTYKLPTDEGNEDAHSEDRLALLVAIKMNRLFSINKKEMLVEDRPNDMLDAGSTMTVAPQVPLFVLRTHHVQAYAFLLTRAPLADRGTWQQG
jgi:hypothetical protein